MLHFRQLALPPPLALLALVGANSIYFTVLWITLDLYGHYNLLLSFLHMNIDWRFYEVVRSEQV